MHKRYLLDQKHIVMSSTGSKAHCYVIYWIKSTLLCHPIGAASCGLQKQSLKSAGLVIRWAYQH